jgi:hypothetical protein
MDSIMIDGQRGKRPTRAAREARPETTGMPLTESEKMELFETLRAKGWAWDGDCLCSPGTSMRLLRSAHWHGNLEDCLRVMCARLERLRKDESIHHQDTRLADALADTEAVVRVLRDMLNRSRAQGAELSFIKTDPNSVL